MNAGEPSAPEEQPREIEPKVRGESLHDQITSFLMAVVIGATLVVAWLVLIYFTNKAYAERVTAPVQIVEVFGGGGGSPEGTIGQSLSAGEPDAPSGEAASNNPDDAAAFEEPTVELAPSATLDTMDSLAADLPQEMLDVDLGDTLPDNASSTTGSSFSSGRRASIRGTGRMGWGFGGGPGDAGVPREQRWVIVYNPGQGLDEYARQLDALGVELGTVAGRNLAYASNLSGSPPTRRTGTSSGERRLYFLWQGGSRKETDVALLQKAGIEVGGGPVFQFYPDEVVDKLAQLEVRYRGRQPIEIRRTRFIVVPRGGSYDFEVQSQEPLQ